MVILSSARLSVRQHRVRSHGGLTSSGRIASITETGIGSEITADGLTSRVGQGRTDVVHQWLDPLIVVGPWVLAGVLAFRGVRALSRLANRRTIA